MFHPQTAEWIVRSVQRRRRNFHQNHARAKEENTPRVTPRARAVSCAPVRHPLKLFGFAWRERLLVYDFYNGPLMCVGIPQSAFDAPLLGEVLLADWLAPFIASKLRVLRLRVLNGPDFKDRARNT